MAAATPHQQSTTITGTASNINNLASTLMPVQKDSFTAEEDDKLARAVNELGRTNNQCCKRWICFLDPAINMAIKKLVVEREADCQQNKLPLGKWTFDEDVKLRVAVQKYGEKKWVKVASKIPRRTRVTCRKRWVFYLGATDRTTGLWTTEEDAKLASAVRTHHGCYNGSTKRDWAAISAVVQSRTPTQCYERSVRLSDAGARTMGEWPAEEVDDLATAVRTHGKNWQLIAPLVPGRTNEQRRKRWVGKNADQETVNSRRIQS